MCESVVLFFLLDDLLNKETLVISILVVGVSKGRSDSRVKEIRSEYD